MKEGISACIIGKNEEKNLKRCLKSIESVVDEIIYLDTGSLDKSMEVVKTFGGRIFQQPFEDDFAKARNSCIDKATYQWILVIDCDEELSEGSKTVLKQLIKEDKGEAYFVNIINIIEGKRADVFQYTRLFKNKPQYSFRGKIHEQITWSVVKEAGMASIGYSNIELYHYGYDSNPELAKAKSERNIRLLWSIPKEERNAFYYYNLGNEYTKRKAFKEALINYEKSLSLTFSEDMYTVLLYERMAHCYYSQGYYEAAIDIAQRGSKTYPNHVFFYYIIALAFTNQMKFSKALEYFCKTKDLMELQGERGEEIGMGVKDTKELNEAMKELRDCVMPRYEGMVTSIIDCRGKNKVSLDTIFSVNEISDEVILLYDEGLEEKNKGITTYTALEVKSTMEIKTVIRSILTSIKTKYILYLNQGEGLTFEDEFILSKTLVKEEPLYLVFYINSLRKKEIRLVKKDNLEALMKVTKERAPIGISYF